MANYLPVLLVSVNQNAIPDDNVLTNIPCGQVDYLSHDWQEEDVWRSWRNMTRQKNEITNGLRLENASWRTWWKQRNKLKTVSPETLNWLKDSDVTWLYGPLHTAMDWSPPPKPDPVPDSVDRINPTSTQDRLDLHSSPARTSCQPHPPLTKPILKHRSISELLSFDLPVSPIFSPHDSDNDDDAQSSTQSPRPCIPHTKSDTQITRWGLSRAFRKESPPRVSPPARKSAVRAPGPVRPSLSQDSTSSVSASGSTERPPKRKHISFNTFVEQCIAIDKHPRPIPRKRPGFGFGDYFDNELSFGDQGEDGDDHRWEDDDGYEEDREDNFFDEDDPLWLAAHGGAHPRRRHLNGSAIHSDSDSDDGVIEIRPSTYRHSNLGTPHAKKKAPPRSKSASSSSSATTSTTTSSTSSSTGFRQRRKSASAALDSVFSPNFLSVPPQTSAYRPRPSHADQPYRDRVTIAPIAPTFLKTTGAWEESFGDEGGASDDGLWDYGVPGHGVNDRSGGDDDMNKGGNKYDEEQSSDGTPVELVYVPPFGSIYGYGAQAYWRNQRGQVEDVEDEEDEMTEDVEVKSQFVALEQAPKNSPPQNEDSPPPTPLIPPEPSALVSRSPVPVVIIDSSADSESAPSESDGIEYNSNSSNSTSITTTPVPVPSREPQLQEERGRGRGRSLSISPVGGSNTNTSNKAPAPAPTPAPALPSSTSSGSLLTSRGRSQSCQDLQSFYNASVVTASIQTGERRGRSSMRGSSTGSNSASTRGINSSRNSQSHSGGRSGESLSPYNSSTSPIGGSLSPDGGDTKLGGGIGNVYASGRMGGRERESRFERNSSSSSLSSKATSTGSDERRGRDRGRRDVCSGSGSSTSPIANTSSPEESRGRSGRSIRGREGGERVSLSPQDVFDVERTPVSTPSSPVMIAAKEESSTSSADSGIMINDALKMELDASMCSVSSEGSTATIVPTSNVVSPKHKVAAVKGQAPVTPALDVPSSLTTDREREMQFEREALEEADKWRKNVPTPSNSPTISMTATAIMSGAAPTTRTTLPLIQTQSIEYSPRHVRTCSSSIHSPNSPSPSKYKPKSPFITPSLPHPALPSTSSSYAPGEVGVSGTFTTNSDVRSASTSLERTSSGSRERQSPSAGSSSGGSTVAYTGSGLRKEITPDREFERELAEARRGRNGGVSGRATRIWMNGNGGVVMGAVMEPTSPVTDGGYSRETIIDKAVGMVSSAGAYLRLWPGQSHNAGAGAAQ